MNIGMNLSSKHYLTPRTLKKDFAATLFTFRGRDSSVDIATRYGLDGPGIESQWGTRFSASVQTGTGGPPSLLYNGYRVLPESKAAGAWC